MYRKLNKYHSMTQKKNNITSKDYADLFIEHRN